MFLLRVSSRLKPALGLPFFLFLGPAGCGGPPPPASMASPKRVCPLPMAWSEGQVRPRRLQMTNGMGIPLSVWLDNCTGHTRLGDVPPGQTFLLPLPNRLIPYAHRLRLHVFDRQAMIRVGSYAVELEPQWTLGLEVDEGTPAEEITYEDSTGVTGVEPPLKGFVTSDGTGFSYLARWSEDGSSVLTWQCIHEEPKLTLTYHGTAPEKVPVTIGYRGGKGTTRGAWAVYRGSARMLRAPDGAMREITRRAGDSQALEITLGDPVSGETLTFDMAGFGEAGRVLGCLGLGGG